MDIIISFVVGIVSGWTGNFVWSKFKPERKEEHLVVDISNDRIIFTGSIKAKESKSKNGFLDVIAKASDDIDLP